MNKNVNTHGKFNIFELSVQLGKMQKHTCKALSEYNQGNCKK